MATLLRGRYEPVEVVGRGGQGEVLKALDRVHDRAVALKVRRVGSPEERTALLAEARVLLGLKPHPGMPLVREDFFVRDRYYLVTDWVEGSNLERVLREQGDPGLPFATVLRYIGQVAETLDRVHANDPPIVHGDVKPANLIVTPSGRVVLVDFGIAGPKVDRGPRLGTEGYAAPEVAAGGPRTPAVDVYALAATTFALLTGSPPGLGADPGALPPDVHTVIRRGLSSDPTRRPRSASAFVDQLRRWLEASPDTGTLAGGPVASAAGSVDAVAKVPRARAGFRLRPRHVAAMLALVAVAASVPLVTRRPGTTERSGSPLPGGSGIAASSQLPSGVARPTGSAGGTIGSLPATRPSGTGPTPGVSVPITLPAEGDYAYSVDSTESRQGSNPTTRENVRTVVTVERRSVSQPEFSFGMSFTAPDETIKTHQEIEWIAYGASGLSITHERLDVRGCDPLRPVTVCIASEADFEPPMLLLPYPAKVGQVWAKKTSVPGSQRRTQSYHGKVLGRQRLAAAGRTFDTVVVEWWTTFDGAESGTRHRKVWFAPEAGINIRFEEDLTWELSGGGEYSSSAEWELLALPK